MPSPATPNYALGLDFNAAGTVAVTATSANVTGTGTAFLTEFAVGDVIIIGAARHRVVTRFSDTALTISPVSAVTASGLAIAGSSLIALQDLPELVTGTPEKMTAPKGLFVRYTQPIDLGDGGLRGGGWATAEWQWGFMPRWMRDVLRGGWFQAGSPPVPVASKLLYMRTSVYESSDQYRVFQAQAIWPQAEARVATRRIGFSLKFRALVQIGEY